jgi:hypothetical protein
MTYQHFDYKLGLGLHRTGPTQTPAPVLKTEYPRDKSLNRKSEAKKRWWAEKKAREADDGTI